MHLPPLWSLPTSFQSQSIQPLRTAKYDFNYTVKDLPSGNALRHQPTIIGTWRLTRSSTPNRLEARDGDNTQGSYYILLPDGRLQKVTYTVNGDPGYVSDVTYEGEAQYPNPKDGPPHPSY
ncbi:pro-resilin-like [Penaeus japonicus]|uniref:pro-resilin-like n=1 Tax=Penaeus japonicus TaxID=27405 RepID=UPI001C715939|nr:pro-resilin-like [Penaeus japonicus]